MSTAVLFNKPNLIGYNRLILLFISLFCKDTMFILFYLTSVSLDYFDGKVARFFGEVSALGACLDMVTDRLSTAMLCIKIVQRKPDFYILCMSFVFFDILSHFLYFISTIYCKVPHKAFKSNMLLAIYYNDIVLKVLCSTTELYFIALYYVKSPTILLRYFAAIPLIKTFFHLIHLQVGLITLSDVAQ